MLTYSVRFESGAARVAVGFGNATAILIKVGAIAMRPVSLTILTCEWGAARKISGNVGTSTDVLIVCPAAAIGIIS